VACMRSVAQLKAPASPRDGAKNFWVVDRS
jgi:hypothetical protein